MQSKIKEKASSLTSAISDIFTNEKDEKIKKLEARVVELEAENIELKRFKSFNTPDDLAFESIRNYNKCISDHVVETCDLVEKSINGKNSFERRLALNELSDKIHKVCSYDGLNIGNLKIIEDAINEDKDLHSYPLKHHKLELVSHHVTMDMGQLVVNRKKTIEVKHD
jgi:hypothetical protein